MAARAPDISVYSEGSRPRASGIQTLKSCGFVTSHGVRCPGAARESGLCKFHDPEAPKDDPNLKAELEQWAREGHPLQGLQMAGADLRDIDLKRHGAGVGFDLSGSDFYRAKLCGAQLFRDNLSGCSFMRADLRAADMNRTNLRDANFLGARLEWARIAQVDWGEINLQERYARRAFERGHHRIAIEHYDRAQEVYRCLRIASDRQGHHDAAARFRYRELTVRRKLMPRYSGSRLLSHIFDWGCGYGERPERVVWSAVLLIFLFALLYAVTGIEAAGVVQRVSLDRSLSENLSVLGDGIGLSAMTFTTRGNTGTSVVPSMGMVAALEAFSGAFSTAVFVLVLIRRALR